MLLSNRFDHGPKGTLKAMVISNDLCLAAEANMKKLSRRYSRKSFNGEMFSYG